MAIKSIDSAAKRFTIKWNDSIETRYKAACIYAEACNELSYEASSAFKSLKCFANWKHSQWRLLYYIGSGAIPKCYLDFHCVSVPLALRLRGVSYEEQEEIYNKGLNLADISGKVRNVKMRDIQVKHILQVWDTNGQKRSILQQLKWLQDRQKANFDVLPDGTVRVNHRCYITPATMVQLLSTRPYPVKKAALAEVMKVVSD
jgi:hypothetical protein